MDIHESATLDIPVSKLWTLLNDPNILKLCVPGCEEITAIDENTYNVKAVIKVGFISSKFNNLFVKIVQKVENQLLTFEMSGEDVNNIGSFKQNLTIKMSETVEGTTKTKISIDARIDLKGKFATLGKRIVEWKAKNVMEEFVENLRKLPK